MENKFKIGDELFLRSHAISGVLKKIIITGIFIREEGVYYDDHLTKMYDANYSFREEDNLCDKETAEKLIRNYFDKQCAKALRGEIDE